MDPAVSAESTFVYEVSRDPTNADSAYSYVVSRTVRISAL